MATPGVSDCAAGKLPQSEAEGQANTEEASIDAVAAQSPQGDCAQPLEAHARPILKMVPEEHQVECWMKIAAAEQLITGTKVKAVVAAFLEENGIQPKPGRKPKNPGGTSHPKPPEADVRKQVALSFYRLFEAVRSRCPISDIENLCIELGTLLNLPPKAA